MFYVTWLDETDGDVESDSFATESEANEYADSDATANAVPGTVLIHKAGEPDYFDDEPPYYQRIEDGVCDELGTDRNLDW